MEAEYHIGYADYPDPPKPLHLPGDIDISCAAGKTTMVVFFCATEEQMNRGEISARHGTWSRLFPIEERGRSMESDVALQVTLHDASCLVVTGKSAQHQLYDHQTLDANIVRGGDYKYPFIIEISPPQIRISRTSGADLDVDAAKHFHFYSLNTRVDAIASKLEFEWMQNPYTKSAAEGVSS